MVSPGPVSMVKKLIFLASPSSTGKIVLHFSIPCLR